MTKIELLGALFGLVSVWLTARGNLWCWPTGIVNTLLFIVMFWGARLYGDVVTNVMFLVLSVYGWHQWLRGGTGGGGRRIAWASRPVRLATAAVTAAAIPSAGWLLARVGSALPWWDGAILALSFVAQWLLARKLVESWLLWIVVDMISIGVYLARGLYATTALYAIFLGLAVHGLRRWRRGALTLGGDPL